LILTYITLDVIIDAHDIAPLHYLCRLLISIISWVGQTARMGEVWADQRGIVAIIKAH
jgi:hypothetical protein